ncbi:MAG: hypothetical protein WD627_00640 [Actinomycetota bacterium]
MKRMFGATLVAMALVAIMVPTMASAVVTSHSIGSTGTRFDIGRFVQVSVTATCTVNEVVFVRGTVTQDDAIGEGAAAQFCTGVAQTLPIPIRALGGTFDGGTSTLCIVVATVNQVRVTEAEQTCANITLT